MTLRKKIGRSKYGNIPITLSGYRFDSKREGYRWLELRQQEIEGKITKLARQVVFPLIINGQLICKYRADFVYHRNGLRIIEDSKGVRTDAYRIKAKLMKAILDIEILET